MRVGNKERYCHVDHLRHTGETTPDGEEWTQEEGIAPSTQEEKTTPLAHKNRVPRTPITPMREHPETPDRNGDLEQPQPPVDDDPELRRLATPPLRRSNRLRHAPQRLDL